MGGVIFTLLQYITFVLNFLLAVGGKTEEEDRKGAAVCVHSLPRQGGCARVGARKHQFIRTDVALP